MKAVGFVIHSGLLRIDPHRHDWKHKIPSSCQSLTEWVGFYGPFSKVPNVKKKAWIEKHQSALTAALKKHFVFGQYTHM